MRGDGAQHLGKTLLVSADEIIRELPHLGEPERRAIQNALLEGANSDPEIAKCDEIASRGAAILDRMEEEDDARP